MFYFQFYKLVCNVWSPIQVDSGEIVWTGGLGDSTDKHFDDCLFQ